MKELLFFYLPSCPHCQLAIRFIDELKQENPGYAAIPLTMIDESRERARADSYDYWYVPCFYLGSDKLHEGHAEKSDIRRVLDAALE